MTSPGVGYIYSVNITPTTEQQRKRPQWVWTVGDWRGLPDTELVKANSRKLNISLLDPSTASFSLNGDSEAALHITDLVSDVRAYRNGVPLFRGRVTATNDSIDETAYTLGVTCTDYRGLLDRRNTDAVTYTSTAQETIVWDLIGDAQNLNGGDLGLTKGQWPSTGVVRDSVEVKAGDSVWDTITKLAQMDNGFELDITTDNVVDLYWPQRGGLDKGVVLDYGGNVVKANGQTSHDTYANSVLEVGDQSLEPIVQDASDITDRPEGRWDITFTDTDIKTGPLLTAAANGKLALYSQLRTAWTLTLKPGRWRGPEHVWVGDIVTYVVKRGRRFDVNQARVYEIDIDIDESGQETVSITVDRPRDSDARLIKRMAKKIRYLSRR